MKSSNSSWRTQVPTQGRAPFSFVRSRSGRLLSLALISLLLGTWVYIPVPRASSAGLDSVTATLSVETVSAAALVTVAFEVSTLGNGDVIKIYLGETTGGQSWGLNAVTTTDISCSDNGTGETYTVNSVTAASATVPMFTQITATTVGSGASTVTCLIGDGAPNPTNPSQADGYSIAVVTTDDTGAGVAYVGNGNDVTVTAQVLPILTLTIASADGAICTTASNVTSCALGVLSTAAVTTGSYSVQVGTNADNGATLAIAEDGDLRSGALDIADIVEDTGGTVTAGVEEYGIAVTAGTGWTESGNFSDDDTPIPSSGTLATTAAPVDVGASTDVDITHRAAVATNTDAASYSHTVTWTATANF